MTMTSQCVIAKRGDTFNVPFIWKPGGVATSLTGMTIVSQARDAVTGDIRCDFVVVPDPDQTTNPGAGRLTKAYDAVVDGTALWVAPAEWVSDIQFTIGGVRTSSEKFLIRVLDDVTE